MPDADRLREMGNIQAINAAVFSARSFTKSEVQSLLDQAAVGANKW